MQNTVHLFGHLCDPPVTFRRKTQMQNQRCRTCQKDDPCALTAKLPECQRCSCQIHNYIVKNLPIDLEISK